MSGRVLITGGHGNLGSYITKKLCSSGYEVYVLTSTLKTSIKDLDYKIVEVDITDFDTLEKKLNFDIDYCVHLASFNENFLKGYPKKALEINSLGTRNLLEILSQKEIKNFIYFSTFHVYGQSSGDVDEESQLNPKNDYASTHLFAEYYVKQFGFTKKLPHTIFRLTNSYGAPVFLDTNKWYLVLNDLTKTAYEKGKIVLNSNGKAKRDFIYMGDVATIVNDFLKMNATNDIYNLSSNQCYEVIELAYLVKKVYDKRYNKTIEIEVNENDKSQYQKLSVKNDKLKSLLNFKLHNNFEKEIENIFKLLESR
ncbi:hypothetical protein CRV08_06120 [Halarcobacter ebronensis]|uniref:NAD-dependent epimerase/dehydratase domain-containing protein n=1 Tax=Halarcobacter ebronensis TaxID=1462615 RepID=A0A4Q0YFR5_9BACT|nr:NAD(P)-dependent oxidoreductase [Halarcobacter ebronensis]RXJ69005.1 hypothetical protein CRV08_06120 [Halarcobacter ebronensis]